MSYSILSFVKAAALDVGKFTCIEEQLKTAIEVSHVGFYEWDIANDVVTFSEQMRRDWGYSLSEPLSDLAARIYVDDRERTLRLIQEAIEHRTPYSTEYRVQRPDGTLIWVKAQGKCFYQDLRPIRFFGTSIDISEHKKLEQLLEKSKAEADKANAQKSFFLAGIAHELRTPLASILGFADLLRDPKLAEPRRQGFVEKVIKHGMGLQRILNDLLDISKLEAGEMELEISEINLGDLMNEVVDLFTETVRKKGISLVMNLVNEIPTKIYCDHVRLKQVFTNLVGNAIKFTSRGSVEVSLTAKPVAKGKFKFSATIKDTGEGISNSHQQRIFQPFRQAEASTQRRHGGTGLGLVLSKHIARSLGGDIGIEQSCPGQGSTFWFTFLAEAPNEESTAPGEATTSRNILFTNLRILLADDSPDTSYLTSHLLKKSGAEVSIAKNGLEAWRMGLEGDFDIVLMDVEMPEMNGCEATRHLREDGFKKPIIALSGHSEPFERQKTLSAGCSAHFVKPLNPVDLAAFLEMKPPS